MPNNVAKLTAVVVTSLIVFGTDGDILRAVPLGLFAGILATSFIAMADALQPAYSGR
jgi:hypothetical protein